MKLGWLVVGLLLASCSQGGDQPGILDEDEFASAYVELLDSASAAKTDHPDSLLSPAAQRILERRDISVEEFNATVAEYNKDTKQWEAFYAQVIRKIRDRDSTAGAERTIQEELPR